MIKKLLAAVAIALAPGLVLAQDAPAKPAQKKTAKVAKASKTKTTAKKAETIQVAKAKTASPSASTSPTAIAAAALSAPSPDAQALAERVYVGEMACELGASVRVAADAQAPGSFHLEGKGFKYHMTPVATSTGAVRLEDQKAGAVWLQIGNKSMLMDQKRGQRLADECKSPEQVAVAEAMKKAPPQNLLETPPSK